MSWTFSEYQAFGGAEMLPYGDRGSWGNSVEEDGVGKGIGGDSAASLKAS